VAEALAVGVLVGDRVGVRELVAVEVALGTGGSV